MYLDFIEFYYYNRLCIFYADRCCINFFCFHNDNENEPVEAHIPRHRDSKTKKPRHRDSKTKKPRHQETETNKPRHRDSKEFFQRTKSYDIKIPRWKSHDIEFLWNPDPYAPWYLIQAQTLGRISRSSPESLNPRPRASDLRPGPEFETSDRM